MNINEFFDELNVIATKKQVDDRKRVAKKIAHDLEECFDIWLLDMINGGWLEEHSQQEYEDMIVQTLVEASDGYIDLSDQRTVDHIANVARDVVDTTNKRYMEAEGNENFQFARLVKLPIEADDLPEEVKKSLGADRAMAIGAGQSLWINNFSDYESAVVNGKGTKTWHNVGDDRVRQTESADHVAADLQTVPIDEPFNVSGEYLMFPTDDSLGASDENIINCRCFLTYE